MWVLYCIYFMHINLRHGYSTISNMRRYGHQCQTLFGLFNSFFLSPPIRCISHSLSVYISRSLSLSLRLHLSLSLSCILATPSRQSDLVIADLATPRDRDRPGSPLITDPLCDEKELQCEGHGGRKWKLPSATATEAVWDVGLFDLVDVGLCRWWDCFVGLFDLVDVRCWMWVCLVWWMVCADLSGFFFYFLLRWRWWMCGSGCWWPSVLLRQWLFVAVVAAWWLGRG